MTPTDFPDKRMPNADDMVLFADLVKAGGFSKAAQQLSLPKSTISRRIAKLEGELGQRLIERNTRTMRLTEIGQVFLQHCNSIARQVAQATQVVEGLAHGPSGVLCISASYSIGRHLLGPVIKDFLQQCPNVKVRLVLSNKRVDLIEDGFDLAIRVGPLSESNIIAKRIGGSQLSFFASPAYLRTIDPLHTPADLAGLCVMYMSEHDFPPVITLTGPNGPETVQVSLRTLVNDFHVLKSMVADGAGIAMLPDYLCTQEVASGALVEVLPDWSRPPVDFQVVYPSRQGMTPKLRAFLHLLEAHFAQAAP